TGRRGSRGGGTRGSGPSGGRPGVRRRWRGRLRRRRTCRHLGRRTARPARRRYRRWRAGGRFWRASRPARPGTGTASWWHGVPASPGPGRWQRVLAQRSAGVPGAAQVGEPIEFIRADFVVALAPPPTALVLVASVAG